MGNTAFKAKKFKDAIDFYTRAIDVYPTEDATCAIFYNNRGACLSHIKPVQHEKIIGDCTWRLCELGPDLWLSSNQGRGSGVGGRGSGVGGRAALPAVYPPGAYPLRVLTC